MKRLLLTTILLGLSTIFAQSFDYKLITIDSSFDKSASPEIVNYMAQIRPQVEAQMKTPIGECAQILNSYAPQSELSNLLTDMLFEYGNEYSMKENGVPADLSILNFGGIRTSLHAGTLTLGDIFELSPFDNTLVVIALKGSELKKVFNRFSATYNEPYSHAKLTYKKGNLASILVNGQPIDDNRIYQLVTIDFIQTGGDNILKDIQFESVLTTGLVERDLIVDYIKKAGKPITATTDDRAIIE
ncbi:MAG: 5'-nucleotidase C-terminal domain-containing protein [Bacteroidales bacterium]|nr:5'-nucleotidase C-terminal domain-containing protein [Bacteroidales bacterium]